MHSYIFLVKVVMRSCMLASAQTCTHTHIYIYIQAYIHTYMACRCLALPSEASGAKWSIRQSGRSPGALVNVAFAIGLSHRTAASAAKTSHIAIATFCILPIRFRICQTKSSRKFTLCICRVMLAANSRTPFVQLLL